MASEKKNMKCTEVVISLASPRWCSLLRRMVYRSRSLRGQQSSAGEETREKAEAQNSVGTQPTAQVMTHA